MPFESCTNPLTLKILELNSIKLHYAADTWIKIVKFSNLEKLKVRDCAAAEVLFSQLSKAHNRPSRLRSLRWLNSTSSDSEAMEALEGLLESFSNLVTIDIQAGNMSKVPAISLLLSCRSKCEVCFIGFLLSQQVSDG